MGPYPQPGHLAGMPLGPGGGPGLGQTDQQVEMESLQPIRLRASQGTRLKNRMVTL
jgi:hypothetical protein